MVCWEGINTTNTDIIIDSTLYQQDILTNKEKAMLYYRRKGISAAANTFNLDSNLLEKVSNMKIGKYYKPSRKWSFTRAEQYFGARDIMSVAGKSKTDIMDFLREYYQLKEYEVVDILNDDSSFRGRIGCIG